MLVEGDAHGSMGVWRHQRRDEGEQAQGYCEYQQSVC